MGFLRHIIPHIKLHNNVFLSIEKSMDSGFYTLFTFIRGGEVGSETNIRLRVAEMRNMDFACLRETASAKAGIGEWIELIQGRKQYGMIAISDLRFAAGFVC